MHFASLLLASSLLAVALGVGYAPAPQAAPAATSYGNPIPNQFSPGYVPQNQQQQAFNAQPNGFNNLNQLPGTFNTVPRTLQQSSNFQQGSQGTLGNGVNQGFPGSGPVASLASEDDWDSVITARGVKNQKFRPSRRH